MRAIIQTEAPSELPDDIVESVQSAYRDDGETEMFAILEGIAGIGDMSGGNGVYIWTETADDGTLPIHDKNGDQLPIAHRTDYDGEEFQAELTAAGQDGTVFESEERFKESE